MKYIVAISGGIDSVYLLNQMVRDNHQLIVAHVDHGIRDSSAEDRQFVEQLATEYGLAFETTSLNLGKQASEDDARQARYQWLEDRLKFHTADAIVTAHHQDDVIETMLINLARGTGWRGLASLREHPKRLRPLLGISKAEIVDSSIKMGLMWREDETNHNPKYLRNRLRMHVVPKLADKERQKLINLYKSQTQLVKDIDKELENIVRHESNQLDRYFLIMVGREIAGEIIIKMTGQRFERRSLDQIYRFACVGRPGSTLQVAQKSFGLTRRYLVG